MIKHIGRWTCSCGLLRGGGGGGVTIVFSLRICSFVEGGVDGETDFKMDTLTWSTMLPTICDVAIYRTKDEGHCQLWQESDVKNGLCGGYFVI